MEKYHFKHERLKMEEKKNAIAIKNSYKRNENSIVLASDNKINDMFLFVFNRNFVFTPSLFSPSFYFPLYNPERGAGGGDRSTTTIFLQLQ